jgi:hypothetical protein
MTIPRMDLSAFFSEGNKYIQYNNKGKRPSLIRGEYFPPDISTTDPISADDNSQNMDHIHSSTIPTYSRCMLNDNPIPLEGGFDGRDDLPGDIVVHGCLAQIGVTESTGGDRLLAKRMWRRQRDKSYFPWKEGNGVI